MSADWTREDDSNLSELLSGRFEQRQVEDRNRRLDAAQDRAAQKAGEAAFLLETMKRMADECRAARSGQMHGGSRASLALDRAIRLAESAEAVLKDGAR